MIVNCCTKFKVQLVENKWVIHTKVILETVKGSKWSWTLHYLTTSQTSDFDEIFAAGRHLIALANDKKKSFSTDPWGSKREKNQKNENFRNWKFCKFLVTICAVGKVSRCHLQVWQSIRFPIKQGVAGWHPSSHIQEIAFSVLWAVMSKVKVSTLLLPLLQYFWQG